MADASVFQVLAAGIGGALIGGASSFGGVLFTQKYQRENTIRTLGHQTEQDRLKDARSLRDTKMHNLHEAYEVVLLAVSHSSRELEELSSHQDKTGDVYHLDSGTSSSTPKLVREDIIDNTIYYIGQNMPIISDGLTKLGLTVDSSRVQPVYNLGKDIENGLREVKQSVNLARTWEGVHTAIDGWKPEFNSNYQKLEQTARDQLDALEKSI